MAKNRAAWILSPRSKPFSIAEAPTYKPKAKEVLIKNYAVSVNPIDWKNQENGAYQSKYPFILGRNVAGTVEDVGEGVTKFHKGQRVMAHLHSPKTGEYANSAFQLYPIAFESLTAAIPASLSFEQASVLPLSISTAAAGLFLPEYLGLPLPLSKSKTESQTLLVWGGASSVGMTAIQLAAASGLKVVATASTSNHDIVQSLGASAVYDYKSSSVVEDILGKLKQSKVVAIYDAIGEERSFEPLRAIVKHLHGSTKIATVLPCNNPTKDFSPKFITSYGIVYPPNENIGERIWGDFVPNALASGRLLAKPDPVIVGHALEDIQTGLDLQKAGVSAKKLVITL
ncbi:hypothetical protein N7449_005834 [Penicillium cf. viridicatum]|uniref:Enoyl reductase (ER) domain-containing protein n=1 Tax=Penicillium cf. viridicatum TaxID=2972119 RepID=A0A9W9MGS7_9EURO|nr:hypothetical protein N7449_005834 [Penicillium cf. viridicatum]